MRKTNESCGLSLVMKQRFTSNQCELCLAFSLGILIIAHIIVMSIIDSLVDYVGGLSLQFIVKVEVCHGKKICEIAPTQPVFSNTS